MNAEHDPRSLLSQACHRAGLDDTDADLVRSGENALFLPPRTGIARIARAGQEAAAIREVSISRHLADHDIDVVRTLDDIDQPIIVDGRAVTFWQELPAHRNGTPTEVAHAIRALHQVPLTEGHPFGELDPFVRLGDRIDAAVTLTDDDRDWLRDRLDALRTIYRDLPAGLPPSVIHGDAWVGNIVATDDGRVVLLDLERCSIGPPECDLVSTAIKHTSFGWVSADDYSVFCRIYGHDVTTWDGFALLRDIRELRMTCYMAQHAAENPDARTEAAIRVRSLRGQAGPRPWEWSPADESGLHR